MQVTEQRRSQWYPGADRAPQPKQLQPTATGERAARRLRLPLGSGGGWDEMEELIGELGSDAVSFDRDAAYRPDSARTI